MIVVILRDDLIEHSEVPSFDGCEKTPYERFVLFCNCLNADMLDSHCRNTGVDPDPVRRSSLRSRTTAVTVCPRRVASSVISRPAVQPAPNTTILLTATSSIPGQEYSLSAERIGFCGTA